MDLVGPILNPALNIVDGLLNGDKKVAIAQANAAAAQANAQAAAAQAQAAAQQAQQQMLMYGGLAVGVLVVGAVLFKVLAK